METLAKLAEVEHSIRIYTDGGCDDNGEGGIAGWGACVVHVDRPDAQPESDETPVADLWGRAVLDRRSEWFQGCARATNNTGELTGIAQALLWLLHIDEDTDPAVIVYDSMYAANMVQGRWQPKTNLEVIEQGVRLLAKVRARRAVHFVHSKGHSGFWGNDRADQRADWGKCDVPYSRLRAGGASEGDGVRNRVDENEEASRQLAAKAEADEGRRVAGVTGGVAGAEPVEEDAGEEAAADVGAAATAAVPRGGARRGALGRIDEEMEDGELFINLASNEYFKAIDTKKLKAEVISPVFKDFKNGKLKIISFYAKKARGAMVRYIIDKDVNTLEELKGFDYMDYRFSEEHTEKENKPVFIR